MLALFIKMNSPVIIYILAHFFFIRRQRDHLSLYQPYCPIDLSNAMNPTESYIAPSLSAPLTIVT